MWENRLCRITVKNSQNKGGKNNLYPSGEHIAYFRHKIKNKEFKNEQTNLFKLRDYRKPENSS